MKKIACNLFGENQTIYFNIGRLMQLEVLLKKPILRVITDGFGLTELTAAYSIGLQHEKTRKAQWYAAKMQELLDEGGFSYEDFVQPVMHAIIASGLLGREAYEELFPEEKQEGIDEEIKNG